MNPQRTSKTYSSFAVAVFTLAAGWPSLVLAQAAPRPRVQIIFDTSTSMKISPENTGGFNTPHEMTEVDGLGRLTGDYDPLSATNCVSKFCSAKQVVYSTLPGFSTDARIGMASYFQFLVRYTSPTTEWTKCFYDKVWKPGYSGPETRFTTTTDHGAMGGPLVPSGAATDVGSLAGRCNDVLGSSQYTFNKIGTSVAHTYRCNAFGYDAVAQDSNPLTLSPLPAAQAGFGAATECLAGMTYPVKLAAVKTNASGPAPVAPWAAIGYSIQHVDPATVTCNLAANLAGFVPALGAAPDFTLIGASGLGNWTAGTAVGQWENVGVNDCAGVPCDMYSVATTPNYSDPAQTWYAMQPTPYVPAVVPPNLSAGLANNYGGVVTRVSRQMGTECIGSVALGGPGIGTAFDSDTGVHTWNSFGFVMADATASAGGVSGTNTTPLSGAYPICGNNATTLSGLPCHVTLTNQALAPVLWNNWVPVNYVASGGACPGDPTCPGATEQAQVRSSTGTSPLTNGGLHFVRATNNCGSWAAGVDTACNGHTCLSAAAPGPTVGDRWLSGYTPAACGALRNQCEMVSLGGPVSGWPNGCSNLDTYDETGTPNNCIALNGSSNGYGYNNKNNITVNLTKPPGFDCNGLKNTFIKNADSPLCPLTCATKAAPTPAGQNPCQCKIHDGTAGTASPSSADGADLPSAVSYNRTTPPACPTCVGGVAYSGAPDVTTDLDTEANCTATKGGPATGCSFDFIDPCPTGQIETDAAGRVPGGTVNVCGALTPPCTVDARGIKAWGPKLGENQPMACMFMRQSFQWRVPTTTCTVEIARKNYTVNTTMDVCKYDQRVYETRNQQPQQVDCTYQANFSRHRFNQRVDAVCRYARMMTEYRFDAPQYTYEWATKGGELVSQRNAGGAFTDVNAPWEGWNGYGEHVESVPNLRQCTTAYTNPTGFLGGNCPATINNCDGNPWHECKLRWGQSRTGAGLGRYQFALTRDSRMCMSRDSNPIDAWYAIAPAGGVLAAGNTFMGAGSNQTSGVAATIPGATTCQEDGVAAGSQYKLFSDWYEPGKPNGGPLAVGGNFDLRVGSSPPGYVFDKWNDANQGALGRMATKESGWGRTNASQSAQLFLPIPPDDPSDNAPALRQAMSKCVPPNPASVNPANMQWTMNGLCMADDYFHNGPAVAGYDYTGFGQPDIVYDFTPLYGSLVNTYDYLSAMRDVDADADCRDYFVILATDGLESSPRNYQQTDLENAILDLKGHVPALAPSNTRGIRTYVIGFGDAATGAGSAGLDTMAALGGTGAAYRANNQAALQTALSLVLAQITSGTYSRSKPAISTDGHRVYVSTFTRGLSTTASPEWKGFLHAYEIDPGTGALSLKWEYSDKLNGQVDAARNLYTVNDADWSTQAFTTANAVVKAKLCTDVTCTGLKLGPPLLPPSYTTFDEDDIIKFVRNPGVPGTPAPYFGNLPAPLRSSRAGAIEHSSAVVVSKPGFSTDWGGPVGPQRAAYQAFQTAAAGRPTRLVVGSSDGLLRGIIDNSNTLAYPQCAIDETDPACPNGQEAWGFVPPELLPDLYKLMSANQKNVDNTMVVTDVCGTVAGIPPAATSSDAAGCAAAQWFTLGIGSMREGGRTLFGLRIEDDGAFHTGPSSFQWSFADPDLGKTWSMPVVGRARVGGADHWVAVFGAGKNSGGGEGDAVFAIDAVSGTLIKKFVGPYAVNEHRLDPNDELPGRPAMFRRPMDHYLNSVVMGTTQGKLYVSRFEDPTGASQYDNNDSHWVPIRFFDPSDNNDRKDVNNNTTQIMTVRATCGSGTAPACAALQVPAYTLEQVDCSVGGNVADSPCDTQLPISVVSPLPAIYARPKTAIIYDGSGNTGDYFVGTGDGVTPGAPAFPKNFFYALHDRNQQDAPPNPKHDGVPLWVFRFPNDKEQVISEPVVTHGDIVVAAYIPPAGGGACALSGDTMLYSFNPKTGALVPSLVIPSFMPGAGTKTSVLRLNNVGIPSDLLQIGKQLTFNTSQGGMMQVGHVPPLKGGDIRSFRRVR